MRSDIAAKAPENRRSRRRTPHNRALRIIDVMRCTALRRNRRSVVQAFRREPRLPLGQAGRSELQRSDLRQSLRRRGRRGLHAHLVPQRPPQWRLTYRRGLARGNRAGQYSYQLCGKTAHLEDHLQDGQRPAKARHLVCAEKFPFTPRDLIKLNFFPWTATRSKSPKEAQKPSL